MEMEKCPSFFHETQNKGLFAWFPFVGGMINAASGNKYILISLRSAACEVAIISVNILVVPQKCCYILQQTKLKYGHDTFCLAEYLLILNSSTQVHHT